MLDRFKNMDWLKVFKGAGIAMAGAGLAYLSQWASGQDFGMAGPAIVAGLSALVNAIHKWATANKEG